MTAKRGSRKKTSSTRSVAPEDKDRRIKELEDRVAILENELRSCREKTAPIDFIDRKRAEEALRVGEERYRSLVESAGAWVWETNQDFVLTYDSPRGLEILGYGPDEVIGRLPFSFMPEDELERIKLIVGPAIARHDPIQRIENRLIKKDGSIATIETTAVPLFDESGRYRGYRGVNHDVTERKRAEEALKESEEKYRFLVENSKDVIWKMDMEARWTFVSGNVEKVNGYRPDEMVGKPIWDFIAPECHDFIRKKLLKRMRGEEIAPYLTWSMNKDGGRTPLEVVTTAITDEAGKIVGVQGISRDITRRLQAEKALQESERRYRDIVEDQTELIALLNIDLVITFVNDAYCRYFGKKREELVGHTLLTLVSEEDREAVKASIAGLSEKDPAASIEQRVKRPDGSLSWTDWKNRIVFDEHGRPTGYQAVGRDITERKRAEKALIREKHILTKSQEAAHVGNWAFDLQTREITGSDEVYRIFGYEPGEVKLSREWVRSHVLPEDLSILDNFMVARVRDGSLGSVDYRIKRRNGSVGYLNTIVDKSVRDNAGRIRRLYGIIQDVSGRKQAEEEMKTAKQQSELYLDLMGHDINNMHQVALGYLELASTMPPGEEQAKLLEKPVEVLQRSTQLILNVRKLQKLQEGVFQTQEVDVCEVLMGVRREFGTIPNKAITLNMNGCDQCLVHANELLHDVFANLVGNAIKHTGDRADVVIDMDILKDNGRKYCRVMVEDNGPGIPDDFKGKIFNRMLRGTTKAKGMGLGLYLVKSLVDSYGGRVWVEDRVQGDHTKGARFVVLLPALEK
ncbi:putative histidine kinase [Methanocella paludicola SANAE]|uniref:histidine kinase n=1 Tax=Methanocella paludicola (strain DSM 17711 / JCM 13418 / NBRC 101707 / SANAE) TaxID=304371 RepID=D1YZQ6_METPS|nr:PAS domain S-box protein [Methanocella paludicola]BAI61928.1 putative histidine kinase [Methanocella paludicola SANAE]